MQTWPHGRALEVVAQEAVLLVRPSLRERPLAVNIAPTGIRPRRRPRTKCQSHVQMGHQRSPEQTPRAST
eukprot:scaffold297958_cov24-Tisochrysis_lutea.AAC.1